MSAQRDPSWQAHLAAWLVRWRIKRALGEIRDLARLRRVFERARLPVPGGVRFRADTLGGVAGEWVEPIRGTPRATLLYLHGGGFVACSPRTHRPITAAFALHGFRVFVPDYRLAPTHPFPAALHDARAVWQALVASTPGPHCVAGDSAGGNLSLALMVALRDAREALPAAAALLSPATDLAGTGASLQINAERDPMFPVPALARMAEAYLNGADPRDPLASPLYADLTGLPPLAIHVGESEVLRDDALRIAERARAAGVAVELAVWPVVPHVWQIGTALLPEARASLAQLTGFLHRMMAPPPLPGEVDVLVIGAGFSGLAMGIRLQQAGVDSFLIVDKGGEVGGTWRDNTYPGAACDIPSLLYSLSFEPEFDWSRLYPRQPELLAYLRSVADKHGLAARLRLRTAVQQAAWDERESLWRVQLSDGASLRARVIVSGTGALHYPALPALPGIESFTGAAFHSARWNHALDLAGKRIAVIGTGASAIQFVPAIAPQAAQLTVFQRTPPWIIPRHDRPLARWERWALRHVPGLRRVVRALTFWSHEARIVNFLHPSWLRGLPERMALRHLHVQLADPQLRRALTPDYRLGCKRVLISSDYYPALTRPNVELVTEPIAQVRARSIVTRDGRERPVDVIVYGTGFEATTAYTHLPVVGRGGRTLAQAWRDGMQAYKGITVAGFPNLFLLMGPNSGLGHNSMITIIESQIRYVMSALTQMRRQGLRAIDVRPDVQQRFVTRVQARLGDTVWLRGGCRSWYLDARGRNTTLWPGTVVGYWWATRRAALHDYDLVAASPAATAP